MSADFVKVYPGFFKGSLVDTPPYARLLFLAMISQADHRGVALGTARFWANYTSITEEQVRESLAILSAPDPESTTPDEEGRRIIPYGDGANQWLIVNYKRYYERGRQEERREYKAAHEKARRDAKRGQSWTGVDRVDKVDTESESESESEKKGKENPPKSPKGGQAFASLPPIPEDLLPIRTALESFIEHRKEIKHPMTARALEMVYAKARKWGFARTLQSIEDSIQGGYQGLFEPRRVSDITAPQLSREERRRLTS